MPDPRPPRALRRDRRRGARAHRRRDHRRLHPRRGAHRGARAARRACVRPGDDRARSRRSCASRDERAHPGDRPRHRHRPVGRVHPARRRHRRVVRAHEPRSSRSTRRTTSRSCSPACTLDQLDAALAPRGLVYPVFPARTARASAATSRTNAGGMRAVKYGVTRHQVLGLEAVLAIGRGDPHRRQVREGDDRLRPHPARSSAPRARSRSSPRRSLKLYPRPAHDGDRARAVRDARRGDRARCRRSSRAASARSSSSTSTCSRWRR